MNKMTATERELLRTTYASANLIYLADLLAREDVWKRFDSLVENEALGPIHLAMAEITLVGRPEALMDALVDPDRVRGEGLISMLALIAAYIEGERAGMAKQMFALAEEEEMP